MCIYCNKKIDGEPIEIVVNEVPLQFCNDDCIIQYHQEQQERNFQSWVNIR